VILIQVALLVAVQLQPVGVVTLTVPLLPSDANNWLVGEIVKVQDMPSWFTVNVWPAIVSVPVRVLMLVLAATE
jgi:hypothetical protein